MNPDLVILDITMPQLDGFVAAREIRKYLPKVLILFVSMHDSQQFAKTARAVGAKGYVVKTKAADALLNAVDAVLRGEEFFPNLEQGGQVQASARTGRAKSAP